MRGVKKVKHLVFKIPADDVEALLKAAEAVAQEYVTRDGTIEAMKFAHRVATELEDPLGEEWLV